VEFHFQKHQHVKIHTTRSVEQDNNIMVQANGFDLCKFKKIYIFTTSFSIIHLHIILPPMLWSLPLKIMYTLVDSHIALPYSIWWTKRH